MLQLTTCGDCCEEARNRLKTGQYLLNYWNVLRCVRNVPNRSSTIYVGKQVLPSGTALGALCLVFSIGCTEVEQRHGELQPDPYLTPDTRHSIALSSSALKEHRAVMLQHLESIQVIMNALVEEDYDLAKGLTESHLGFFMHRQAMASQQPDNFPPPYHDLAMAHHEAAEELARIIPTKDLKQILPKFNNVLKTCVACHHEYKVKSSS